MRHDGIPALRQGEIPCKACGQPGTLSSDERGLRAVTVLHVAQLDGPIAAEYFGGDFEPDWRIERRPDGGFWWCVVEWDGELRVHGTKGEFAAALAEVVRWASPYGPVVSRETRPLPPLDGAGAGGWGTGTPPGVEARGGVALHVHA